MSTITEYQPRYIAYARAHGNTPDAQMATDDEAYPGGCMTGFIIWIGQQWRAWAQETGFTSPIKTARDHANFNEWLKQSA